MENSKNLENLINARYRFAKTMPRNPHEYTMRETWSSREEFEAAVLFIRSAGLVEYFRGKRYICLYHEGFKYWTMGNPLGQTILINRARVRAL